MVRISLPDGFIQVAEVKGSFVIETMLEVRNSRVFMRARKRPIQRAFYLD